MIFPDFLDIGRIFMSDEIAVFSQQIPIRPACCRMIAWSGGFSPWKRENSETAGNRL
jgi:hypothetical protein